MSDLELPPHEPEQDSFAAIETGAPTLASETSESTASTSAPSLTQPAESSELFQSYSQPEAIRPSRIPHLGHLALLGSFLLAGTIVMAVIVLLGLYKHWGGISTQEQMKSNVYYLLGSEAILYLVTFILAYFLFPLFWRKSFFAGIHWRGETALRHAGPLAATAVGCILLAWLDSTLMPGPEHAPIEDVFRTPSAAWLMFGFGVTLAPFFEEIGFRGFLLPSLATAWDWVVERATGKTARPLDEHGHPQWSLPAMVVASLFTSLPFALIHVEQQGHALGPFLLLVTVSLILCAVRLKTRSLASSTLVHACYNFMIFASMLVSTGGFRHLDKM
jgi:hypothetical protein